MAQDNSSSSSSVAHRCQKVEYPDFLVGIDNWFLKCIWKYKGVKKNQGNLDREQQKVLNNQMEDIHSDIKICYKIIKAMCC